jgi:hypothetical protein
LALPRSKIVFGLTTAGLTTKPAGVMKKFADKFAQTKYSSPPLSQSIWSDDAKAV